jgi:hypothetical protein
MTKILRASKPLLSGARHCLKVAVLLFFAPLTIAFVVFKLFIEKPRADFSTQLEPLDCRREDEYDRC